MTPELWQRVKGVFEEALERNQTERPAFLQEACAGEEALRIEVESLLAEEERAGGSFLNNPVIPAFQSLVGKEILHYKVIEKLGEGGMGVVYKARDTRLDRLVALKLLRPRAMVDPDDSGPARMRFLEEARMAGSLSHTNIAAVFDVGEWSGNIYMAQELASGRDLRKMIAEIPLLPLRRTIAIIRQICDGLSHAHARGIVHRDIKPANIVVDLEDRVKITDFGLAQRPQGTDSVRGNVVAGTPGYMAPEQLLAQRVDARADQFSVGCLAYEMLTGRPAFPGETVASIIDKTLHSFPPAPSRIKDDLPSVLDRLVARSIRKEPSERFEKVSVLAQDLQNYEQFEYLTEQNHAVEDIAGALDTRRCLLFLGLHLPIGVGDTLSNTADRRIVHDLSQDLESCVDHRGLARVAQDLELERGRAEMVRRISAAVRSSAVSPSEVLRRVARLLFPVIITTRYDTFLQEELARVDRQVHSVVDCRNVPDDLSGGDLIIRLLGGVEDEESMIVTEDDLWEFYASFHSLSDSLKSLFAQRTILFIGYQPEDEGFRHLLSEIMRFRTGATSECYLTTSDASLPVVRWAQSKRLRLVESQPAKFLSLIEDALVLKRRELESPQLGDSQRPLPTRPYKFLNYYEGIDEVIFFGRQSETTRLASKIYAYPLNLFYGASGSGKTSLISAGLVPMLRREGYAAICTRVYDDPIAEIRRAAVEACGRDFPGTNDIQLHDLLPQLAKRADRRLVIFVDQFEELFIRHNRQARDGFMEALQSTLATGKGQVRFVLCFREDFLARLSEFRDRVPTIFHNEFRLDSLSEEAGRAAITEPARLLGLEVEPALVERLISDLLQEGIDPPQLQIVCDTLFDKLETGKKRLTLASYLAIGETRKILGNYMERVLRELSTEEREPARVILKCLVTSENTKSVSRIADLVRLAGRSEEDVSRILTDLSNRRLIRRVQREDGFWYELTHEYLVEEIGRWLSEKEKELKKVRELLEQAARNYRNLGILMPGTQIRLIRAHEDDLHLNKEEFQFLRKSEQALRGRRRTITIVGTGVAFVLLVCAVTWRYAFLQSHIFVKPQDRQLISYVSARKQTNRMEAIRVYSGSPERWWLDARLGFPKPEYQSDFELDQLEADRRDTVKGGMIFPRLVSVADEIFKMLPPDEVVRFLITTGARDDALKLMPALLNDPTIDGARVDRILTLLGYSGMVDSSLIGHAIAFAFRPTAHQYPPPSSVEHLANFLANFAASDWRPQVVALLADPVRRNGALELLLRLGSKDDAGLVIPYLRSPDQVIEWDDFTQQQLIFRVLTRFSDCRALSTARGLVFGPPSALNYEVIHAVTQYISNCSERDDLTRWERAYSQIAADSRHNPSLEGLLSLIISSVARSGRSALPAVQRMLARWPPNRAKANALSRMLSEEVLSELRGLISAKLPPATRASAAVGLSNLGDVGGLGPAAEIALDSRQDSYIRSTALEAFYWLRGPQIRRLLLGVMKSTRPDQADIRAAACRGLRWYDDDESLAVLLDALKDRDSSVRDAAGDGLVLADSRRTSQWLRDHLDSLTPEAKVYVARALQRTQSLIEQSIFLNYLQNDADNSNDYDALETAIIGLREFYVTQPVGNVVDALRDTNRAIRLAATLALAERLDQDNVGEALKRATAEKDLRFRLVARRALWASSIRSRMRAQLLAEDEALSRGDANSAWKIQMDLLKDNIDGLTMGLSVKKPRADDEDWSSQNRYLLGNVFSDPSSEEDLQQARAFLALRRNSDAVEALGFRCDQPTLRKSLIADARFEKLKQYYKFRVRCAIESPRTVTSIDFPGVSIGTKQ